MSTTKCNYVEVKFEGIKYPSFLAGEVDLQAPPVIVPTLRTNEQQVIGMMFRDMPAPSLLNGFVGSLGIMDPDSKRKIAGALGDAGFGKSYLGEFMMRLWSERGGKITDCAGLDLSSLLSSVVIDENGESIFKLLESKDLEPTTMIAIQSLLPDGEVITRGRRIIFDRDKINERIGNSGLQTVLEINETLTSLARLEGIHMASNGEMTFKSVEGTLLKFGQPQLLDEVGSGRPGTAKSLNMFLQLLIGQTKEHTVEISPTKSVTVRAEDIPPGSFIFFTSNFATDGLGTQTLDQSLIRRIRPTYVGTPTVQDWQHRICQYLTGMPISTLLKFADPKYQSDQVTAKAQEEFAQILINLRAYGLTYEQALEIPSHQFTYIKNWKIVVEYTEKLAILLDEWNKITSPSRAANDQNIPPDVMEQIDDDLRKQACIDMTLPGDLINEALKLPFHSSEGVEENLGTRLNRALIQRIYDLTVPLGKDKIYEYLRDKSINLGAVNSQLRQARVAGAGIGVLNCKPVVNPYLRVEEIAGSVRSFLKQEYPYIPDELLEAKNIHTQIAKLPDLKTYGGFINAPSVKENSDDVVGGSMLVDGGNITLSKSDLLDHRSILMALAIPELNPDFSSEQFFNTDLGSEGIKNAEEKRYVQMAEGRNPHGYGTTTLLCRLSGTEEETATLHVVVNQSKTGKNILLVGPAIDDNLKKMLAKKDVIYIGREEKGVVGKITAALKDLAIDTETQKTLLLAFSIRNNIGNETKLVNVLAQESECLLPSVVTNIRSLEEFNALSRQLKLVEGGAVKNLVKAVA